MKAVRHLAIAPLLALTIASITAAAPVAFAQHYTQIDLVASKSGVAPVTDPNLINPWGMSRMSGSPWWIADNGTGLSTLYNGAGAINPLVVTIPKSDPASKTFPTGTPTGTIANGSPTDFLLAPKLPALFLFATIDGTISGWNPAVGLAPGQTAPSKQAAIVVRTKDGSSYTGLTSAKILGKTYLYAANFTNGRVDVWDSAFHKINLPKQQDKDAEPVRNQSVSDKDKDDDDNDRAFFDRELPNNYVPFNVQAIGNDIVVTYVLHEDGKPFETDGPGLGYVDVYSSSGQLLQRLQHGNWFNAPWGVALAPLDFGGYSHTLLIGQFAGGSITQSSGTIAVFDLVSGNFIGQLKGADLKLLSIPGIWAISPGNSASPSSYDAAGAPASELYFTAGPQHGTEGVFGYLKPIPTELTQGNNQ